MKRNLFWACMMAVAVFGFVGCGGKTTTEGGTTVGVGATSGANPDAAGDAAAGAFDPSGSYALSKGDGTAATLKVTKSGDNVSYTLDASVGNAAEMNRSASMTLVGDKKYEDNDDACQIDFQFGAGTVSLSYGADFQGCGEVDCAGSYTKQ